MALGTIRTTMYPTCVLYFNTVIAGFLHSFEKSQGNKTRIEFFWISAQK